MVSNRNCYRSMYGSLSEVEEEVYGHEHEDNQRVSKHLKAARGLDCVVGLRVRFSRLGSMRVRSWQTAEKRGLERAHGWDVVLLRR
jgi:hypothetical protein